MSSFVNEEQMNEIRPNDSKTLNCMLSEDISAVITVEKINITLVTFLNHWAQFILLW